MRHALITLIALLALIAAPLAAQVPRFTFDNIDGGTHDLTGWRGQPVLVVNTASLCAFSGQYAALQALQDRFADRGLVVLAVPSDDFRQELDSDTEVKDYCELTYGITLPMTTITGVTGPDAHPFYRWLETDEDFVPGWNFNKVLLDGEGRVVATWGAPVRPMSQAITREITALLPAG